ncbi:TetR/AcrR family transcriptional regulator [Thalassotalea maritima]|uniref:TetR/AcrR family transcriptional regulator n=1 Tax=Thalassotalea maritima TaxID=3242416 RepID=UPI003527CE31
MEKHRVRSKSETKRKSILAAASQCFCDNGFAASSMDAIAKAAGVSKQTVYSHFGNKDELFLEVIKQKCQEFQDAVLPTISRDKVEPALTHFSCQFVRLLLSDEGMSGHRLCIAESQTNPTVSQLFFSAGPKRVIEVLMQLLQHFVDLEQLVIGDIRSAALQLLCMVKGEAVMRREYNTEQQVSEVAMDRYIADSVALFIRGYRPQQS